MPADSNLKGFAELVDDQLVEGLRKKGSMAWCLNSKTPDTLQQHLTYLRSRLGLSSASTAAIHDVFKLTMVPPETVHT